jgi:hypothetical protein
VIATDSARVQWLRRTAQLGLSLLALVSVFLLAGCSDSAEPLDEQAAAQFDIANNAIADLTAAGGDDVRANELRGSVTRAQAAGTTLRVVVSAPETDVVSAKAVVDRYGGTALSYQVGGAAFEVASSDMSAEQLDRAINAAKVEFDIGDSAAAFVNVIESEGIEASGRAFTRAAFLLLLIPAALFMLSGAWSYMQARRSRLKRNNAFTERKAVLADWASRLNPEVESLRPLVASSPNDAAQITWDEAQHFVHSMSTTLAMASNVGELDAAEKQLGRTATKLRDLRRSLDQ